jgi:UPF0755 protein
MLKKIKLIVVFIFIIGFITASFFYLHFKVYRVASNLNREVEFKIEKGENTLKIGENLEEEKIISGKYYFAYYIWKSGLKGKIVAGKYILPPHLSIPEIAVIITTGEIQSGQIKITFPEGWMIKDMKERLRNNNFNVDKFDDLVTNPPYFSDKYGYEFLSQVPKGKNLEGYLFPDTYYFGKNATSEEMIKKMLDNFNDKLTPDLQTEINSQGKTIYEIVTMASIIEGEVKSAEDRKIVSGIFWNRIKNGQALQSCATLAFVLGENKKQYSFEDTRVESPYNCYLNKGLPPGPINNPGLVSIMAAIYPIATDYNYFLTDPATGKTIFSKTIEEHNANKLKYGL